jgi:ribosomal subunit interface protein
MQVSVSGQHISIGNALHNYVEERIKDVVKKYFEHAISATVKFSKQGFQFVCDIEVNDGTGRHLIIRSDYKCDEIYSSFDTALVKIEKQLRKYKSKLKDRHNRIKVSQIEATKYVITPHQINDEEDEEPNTDDNPTIIAEKPIDVLPLSISEAVMKMDLENFPALMFQNIKTGRINVVYYRRDGNISWVDSK